MPIFNTISIFLSELLNEDYSLFIARLIAIATFVGPILIFIFGYRKYSKLQKQTRINPGNGVIDALLYKKFPYYRQLPDLHKEEFRQRTLQFANKIYWHSGDGIKVTDEMKLLISATANQIIFGLHSIDLRPFRNIAVFAKPYTNPHTQREHKGEVNNNSIFLCWKNFEEGFDNYTDKINLGLHEMAHALDLSVSMTKGRRFYLSRLIDYFRKCNIDEFYRLKDGQKHLLRQYGGTNLREFFAVSVEHFFEAPEDMQQEVPQMYDNLCLVLNQDPLQRIYRGAMEKRFYTPQQVIPKRDRSFFNEDFTTGNALKFSERLITTIIINAVISFVILNQGFLIEEMAVFFIVLLLANWAFAHNKFFKLSILNNYLLIDYPFKRKNSSISIHLKNILFFDIDTGDSQSNMVCAYISKDSISNFEIKIDWPKYQYRQFLTVLAQKGVMVRQDKIWLKQHLEDDK